MILMSYARRGLVLFEEMLWSEQNAHVLSVGVCLSECSLKEFYRKD